MFRQSAYICFVLSCLVLSLSCLVLYCLVLSCPATFDFSRRRPRGFWERTEKQESLHSKSMTGNFCPRAVCVWGCRLRVISDDEAAAASGTAAVEEATRQAGETPLAAMTEEEQMAAAIAMSMGDDPAAASPQPPAAPPPIAAARKISLEVVRTTRLFVRHFYTKTSSLPRQARDKHRKT